MPADTWAATRAGRIEGANPMNDDTTLRKLAEAVVAAGFSGADRTITINALSLWLTANPEPAQPDAATGDTYLHDMARAYQETAAVRAAERDSLSKRNAELREMLEESIRSEDAARAALASAERALAEANAYIRDYAHPRADALRSALVEIRGLALPYVTGDTREAWRAREVCRLVDEATGTANPPPAVEASGDTFMPVVRCGCWVGDGSCHVHEVPLEVGEGYARGLADAAEAIAAWLDGFAAGALASGFVRGGAWRKYLKKGT